MKKLHAISIPVALLLLSSIALAATWEVDKASYSTANNRFAVVGTYTETLPDLTATDVTIRFDAFEQTIPEGSFEEKPGFFVYKGDDAGIMRIAVNTREGSFSFSGFADIPNFESPAWVQLRAAEDNYCRLLTMATRSGVKWAHDANTDEQSPCDTEVPNVNITAPTHFPSFATNVSTVDLAGIASDDVAIEEIRWETDKGYAGPADGTTEWEVLAISLELGDNVVTVTARDTAGNENSDNLTVTYNTAVDFLGIPRTTPDAIFVGEPTVVTINASIGDSPDLDVNSVKVVKTYNDGSLIDVGPLYDDGNLDHCDEIDLDGVFSGCYEFTQNVEGEETFRVAASTLSAPDQYYSPSFSINGILHVTDEQLEQVIENADTAKETYDQAIAAGQTPDGALEEALVFLETQAEIVQAGVAETGQGLWWLEDTGLLGGVNLPVEGQRRQRGGSVERGQPTLIPISPSHNNISSLHAPRPSFETLFASNGDAYIGSTNAKVMAAYFTQFEGWGGDETEEINQWLVNSICPEFNVTYLKDAQVTVDEFKDLSDYGVIAITSHGDTWYKGLLSLLTEQWGWDWFGGQVVILSRQAATAANKAAYETDLKQGRLAITPGGTFAILPSFISYHNSVLPKSVVYAGSCRSAYNHSMSNAFIAAGSKTYFGYTEYVDSPFAYSVGKTLFDEMINSGATTGDAFIPGQSDGLAEFVMYGSDAIALHPTQIQNPGFEEGNLLGWTAIGDGRVITQLGAAGPTEGSFMGIISTGLGFTVDQGSISQSVCVPNLSPEESKLTLKYDWNFYSEEFLEWCGSIYQDWFQSSIETTLYQFNNIDSLCGSVAPSDVSFDQGDVYNTGWNSAAYEITNWVGQSGTLRFGTHDIGDSIYDSAILIDNIRIEAE